MLRQLFFIKNIDAACIAYLKKHCGDLRRAVILSPDVSEGLLPEIGELHKKVEWLLSEIPLLHARLRDAYGDLSFHAKYHFSLWEALDELYSTAETIIVVVPQVYAGVIHKGVEHFTARKIKLDSSSDQGMFTTARGPSIVQLDFTASKVTPVEVYIPRPQERISTPVKKSRIIRRMMFRTAS